jgi:tRNA dimethylallyltransferase
VSPPDVLALVGPTGTGKTAVSLELAAALDAEIVCGDSRQIFRGLDAATGKPTAAERALRPHHLFDWLEVTESPSAGAYARAARAALAQITARGRVAVVVGGSGLYLRALAVGLARVPPIPETVRRAVREEMAAHGPEELHARLAELDPALAARLAPRDRQRIARGLEVARASGRPLSSWLTEAPPALPAGERWLFLGLTLERATLYGRLDRRTAGFFAGDLLPETRALLARGVPPDAPGLRSLGYAQAVAHLLGRASYETALARAQLETRRYAKRQWTWWRQEGPRVDLRWLEAGESEPPGAVARRALDLWRAGRGETSQAPPAPGTRPG